MEKGNQDSFRNRWKWVIALLLLFHLGFSARGFSQTATEGLLLGIGLTKGQTVYVPLYSHIFIGDTPRPFDLTGTLSIRNTDLKQQITVISATYYDSDGKVVREYLAKPVTLGPLATTYCLVPESDTSGGVGASFIVRWKTATPVNPPIIEAVMIGTRSQQGVSFTSRGQVLTE